MRAFRVAMTTGALLCIMLAHCIGQLQPSALLPDPKMTPGDTLDVTRDDICVPGYSKRVRAVPIEVKRQVYAEYGITSHRPHDYEVDHLISLELGGSNSIRNLWPESYLTKPWNAHVKDVLENKLHALVCSGQLDLKTAQHVIATDWIAAYKKYVRSDPTVPDRSGPLVETPLSPPLGDSSEQVWVNLNSGVYWRPGTRYYGHTKHGKYMAEPAAIQQGYHAGKGR